MKARAKATCISPILKWKNPIWEGITSMWDLCGNFPTIMWEFFPHMPKNPHKSHMLISYRKYVGFFFYKGLTRTRVDSSRILWWLDLTRVGSPKWLDLTRVTDPKWLDLTRVTTKNDLTWLWLEPIMTRVTQRLESQKQTRVESADSSRTSRLESSLKTRERGASTQDNILSIRIYV